MPSNLRACLTKAGVPVPNRDLTVGEMTRLWAQDRYRLAAKRRCGERTVAWYGRLRRDWR